MTKLKLLIVKTYIASFNATFKFLEKILFFRKVKNPSHILVFKVGNIGDTICAMPALLAVRNHFKDAHITYLTSPGKYGMPGAKDFLSSSPLFNDMIVYYREDINSWPKIRRFIDRLKHQKFDLLIHLPEDLAGPKNVLRNLIFAKLINVSGAIGFRMNSASFFKKEQVDNVLAPKETDRLLNVLGLYGIKPEKVDFMFGVSDEHKNKAQVLVSSAFQNVSSKILIAFNPGGKRPGNCWPAERYRGLAEYLHKKYNAKIIVLGGQSEKGLGDEIISGIPAGFSFNACGIISILESGEVLKSCSLLVSNSTGTIHLGAAVGTRCVGLYTIRDIPEKWSPYGDGHKVLLHKNLNCNYNDEACIKKSLDAVTLDEATYACDSILESF